MNCEPCGHESMGIVWCKHSCAICRKEDNNFRTVADDMETIRPDEE